MNSVAANSFSSEPTWFASRSHMSKRGRPAAEYTPKEQKVINFKEATQAVALLQSYERRVRQSKEKRIELGAALILVNDRLAKSGCKGLFTKFLTINGVRHGNAYQWMALSDPKRFKPTQ